MPRRKPVSVSTPTIAATGRDTCPNRISSTPAPISPITAVMLRAPRRSAITPPASTPTAAPTINPVSAPFAVARGMSYISTRADGAKTRTPTNAVFRMTKNRKQRRIGAERRRAIPARRPVPWPTPVDGDESVFLSTFATQGAAERNQRQRDRDPGETHDKTCAAPIPERGEADHRHGRGGGPDIAAERVEGVGAPEPAFRHGSGQDRVIGRVVNRMREAGNRDDEEQHPVTQVPPRSRRSRPPGPAGRRSAPCRRRCGRRRNPIGTWPSTAATLNTVTSRPSAV